MSLRRAMLAVAARSSGLWQRAGAGSGELEMARNRLTFGCLGLAFLVALHPGRVEAPLELLAAYVAAALAILAHILAAPARFRARRMVAIVADSSVLSCELHMGGEAVSLFFCLYLWMVFGNGFRFGLGWLRAATVAACLGFLATCLTTPFWLGQAHLAAGLMAGLVGLPLYAGVLIRRLSQARLAAEEARRVAEEASRAKTLFMASVSHELRTPLTAIIGMGGLLRDTALRPEQREMTQTVEDAARSLLGQIDGLLDFSRIEAGRMPVQPVAFDLAELLRELRGLVSMQARAKGIRVDINITPRTPRRLLASRRHLSDIVINLLSNAVKFTASGGVLIAADAAWGEAGLRLVVEVCDTGIGIAPEAQARVFETFTQADASILNDYGGTGLGLSIARRRAGLLQGSLELRSEPGVGSTFRLDVPVGVVEADVAETGRAGADGAGADGTGAGTGQGTDDERAADGRAADGRAADGRAADGDAAGAVGGVEVVLLAAKAQPVLAGQLRKCGVALQLCSDPEAALSLLAAHRPGSGPPPVLVVVEDGLGCAPERLGPAPATAAGDWVAVLVGEARTPESDRRRQFVSVLARDASLADVAAALHVATVQAGGRWSPEAGQVHRSGPGSGRPGAAGHGGGGSATGESGGPRHRALDVLVADDNTVNQKVFARILERAGHRAHVVSDGEATLDALEGGAAFDLVLMDVNMPGMDGIEVTKLFRFMALGATHLPIVALTADPTPEMASRCLAAGMDACVTKPIAPDELVALVERLAGAPAAVRAGGAATAEAVVPISRHPKYRGAGDVLDETKLRTLQDLGGPAFVTELVGDYLLEAQDSIGQIEAAAAGGDIVAFRFHAHALRSASSNIGARAIGELCDPWQRARLAEVAEQAPQMSRRMRVEFERTRSALLAAASLPGRAEGGG